jgi:hypothetical protein
LLMFVNTYCHIMNKALASDSNSVNCKIEIFKKILERCILII